MNINYKEELNESQYEAVTYIDGPSLVIAGAGSGKTRVLTYKIAYLLENGYNPWNILALTFTNKAAREMKERIACQVGMDRARYLWMGTFHSIFSRILRSEAQYIGFTSQFTIYDTTDSKNLVHSIIKEMKLDEKIYKPGMVQARISNAKNHLLFPTKYAAELVKKMEKSGAKAYLVNTGWNGTGKRITIKDTRGIIDAILSGDILKAPTKKIPMFNFEVPTELPGVDSGILDPRDTYADASEWETKAKDLADRFIKNFAKYEGNDAGKALVSAGPQK